jgi:hypothetical protein
MEPLVVLTFALCLRTDWLCLGNICVTNVFDAM